MTGPAERAAEQSDPERVLSQALRAMAGGRPVPDPAASEDGRGDGNDAGRRRADGLTITQILLIAAIVGIVIGMGVGLVLVAGT